MRIDTAPRVPGELLVQLKPGVQAEDMPFEVLDHRAAVRPVIDAGYPVLGRHPAHPQRAYFNGLGSKGSLLAPFFANQLAAHLCGEGEIEPQVDVRKHLCRD